MGPAYYLARYGREWVDATLAGMEIALPPEVDSE
jgi:hypothetical protein